MQTIEFYEVTGNRRKRRVAVYISDHMAVTKEGRILNPQTGKPWFRFGFAQLNYAVEFARWVDGLLRDYYLAADVFGQDDLIAVLKWTLPNGVQFYEFIQALEERGSYRLCDADLKRAWKAASRRRWRWFGKELRRCKV
ncbi:hypothetical protein D6833_08255 [Candidatus Parcubacteria bacterium]|nr:MAG: hypothetical protein D6833_08255 [Candidatus Parcubacteria bacterium]